MLTHRTATIIGDIPPDWHPKPLRTLLEKQFSGDWGAAEGEQAVSVLRSTNFTSSGALDFSDVATRYFSSDKAENFGLLKGDLLSESMKLIFWAESVNTRFWKHLALTFSSMIKMFIARQHRMWFLPRLCLSRKNKMWINCQNDISQYRNWSEP